MSEYLNTYKIFSVNMQLDRRGQTNGCFFYRRQTLSQHVTDYSRRKLTHYGHIHKSAGDTMHEGIIAVIDVIVPASDFIWNHVT